MPAGHFLPDSQRRGRAGRRSETCSTCMTERSDSIPARPALCTARMWGSVTGSGPALPWLRPMATITHDTLGWYGIDADGGAVHDVIGTRCDPYTNRLLGGVDYHHCCHSNLVRALAAHAGIAAGTGRGGGARCAERLHVHRLHPRQRALFHEGEPGSAGRLSSNSSARESISGCSNSGPSRGRPICSATANRERTSASRYPLDVRIAQAAGPPESSAWTHVRDTLACLRSAARPRVLPCAHFASLRQARSVRRDGESRIEPLLADERKFRHAATTTRPGEAARLPLTRISSRSGTSPSDAFARSPTPVPCSRSHFVAGGPRRGSAGDRPRSGEARDLRQAKVHSAPRESSPHAEQRGWHPMAEVDGPPVAFHRAPRCLGFIVPYGPSLSIRSGASIGGSVPPSQRDTQRRP